MKRLNFLNQKYLSYLILSIVFLSACFSTFFSFSTASATAETADINTKLLIILDDSKQKPVLPDEYDDIVECVYLSDVSMADSTHIAYAVTKDIAQNEYINSILKYAYKENDARIYIYGNLTMLNNCLYPFGASWASSGRYAAVNISSYVNFWHDHKSGWNEIQVRYSY